MDQPLHIELKEKTLFVTLNSPKRRNALSLEMLNALDQTLDKANKNQEVAVIVLGATGHVFCPGHDLKEMTKARENPDAGRAFFAKTMSTCAQVMQKIVTHRVPVIADVKGIATAAGCQLVASCDLAVASEEATFATPGVNIGLFCSTPMVALSRNIHRKEAMSMLLTGEPVPAEKAVQMGLINAALPADEVDAEIARYTAIIASKSSQTLKIGKEAFYRQIEMPLDEAYDYCAQVMVENMLIDDAKEGIGAFLEKRPANWKS